MGENRIVQTQTMSNRPKQYVTCKRSKKIKCSFCNYTTVCTEYVPDPLKITITCCYLCWFYYSGLNSLFLNYYIRTHEPVFRNRLGTHFLMELLWFVSKWYQLKTNVIILTLLILTNICKFKYIRVHTMKYWNQHSWVIRIFFYHG